MTFRDSTVEWYVNWLTESHPDWTPEQCLEMATGFAILQEPQVKTVVEEEMEEPAIMDDATKMRRLHLTGKELLDILTMVGIPTPTIP
jgi:hypothetical protein